MPTTNRKLKIFLCHSSHDKPTVRELYQRLDAAGWIDAWLDTEKLYPGQDWNYEIEQAVEAADVILVCLSKNSVNKEGYVQRELRIVLDLADYKPEGTLFVIPVRLEECEPPRRLRSWQYADYFPKEERDRAYARLLVSLRMRAMHLGISARDAVDEKARREQAERDEKAKGQTRKEKEEKARRARIERLEPKPEMDIRQVSEKREKNEFEEQVPRQKAHASDYLPTAIPEPTKSNRTFTIATIAAIALIICCVSAWVVWVYGDAIMQALGG